MSDLPRIKTQSEIVEEFEREKKVIHARWAESVEKIQHLCGGSYGCADALERGLRKARRDYEAEFYDLAASYGLFEAKP